MPIFRPPLLVSRAATLLKFLACRQCYYSRRHSLPKKCHISFAFFAAARRGATRTAVAIYGQARMLRRTPQYPSIHAIGYPSDAEKRRHHASASMVSLLCRTCCGVAFRPCY